MDLSSILGILNMSSIILKESKCFIEKISSIIRNSQSVEEIIQGVACL